MARLRKPDTGIDVSGGSEVDAGSTNVEGSTDDVATNTDDVATNTDDVATNTGDMGGESEQADAGPDDVGDDDNTPRYTKRDVSRMIQGRIAELEKHKKVVERIAKQAGISADEVERRLDMLEQQARDQQLERTAKEQGIDPRLLRILADQHRELNRLKLENQLSIMRNSPNDFPGFSEIEGDVLDKAMQLNLSLQDAYWLVAGPKRIQQAAREAEHRTINQRQKLAGKDRVQGDSSSEIGVSSPKIPQDVVAMAKKVNMDPEEYYALMNADNIDDWREFKAKKNKGR